MNPGPRMDMELIIGTLVRHGVEFILIGGMNFLLHHNGPLTFDIDFFVNDTVENRARLNAALRELKCEWGASDTSFKPIAMDPEWLMRMSMFCLTSPYGAIDIFRHVKGLEDGFEPCRQRADRRLTPNGIEYLSLGAADMLRCQEALPVGSQKTSRVEALKRILKHG